MGYCLMCGKLRDTIGGLCMQCRADRATSGIPAAKMKRLMKKRSFRREPPKADGDDDRAQSYQSNNANREGNGK